MNGFCPEQKDGVQEQGMQIFTLFTVESDKKKAKSIGSVLILKNKTGVSFGEKDKHMGFRGVPSADNYLDKWLSSMKM